MRQVWLSAVFLLLACSGVAAPLLQIPPERALPSGQLVADKAARTTAQQKISSALLAAIAELAEDVPTHRKSGVVF